MHVFERGPQLREDLNRVAAVGDVLLKLPGDDLPDREPGVIRMAQRSTRRSRRSGRRVPVPGNPRRTGLASEASGAPRRTGRRARLDQHQSEEARDREQESARRPGPPEPPLPAPDHPRGQPERPHDGENRDPEIRRQEPAEKPFGHMAADQPRDQRHVAGKDQDGHDHQDDRDRHPEQPRARLIPPIRNRPPEFLVRWAPPTVLGPSPRMVGGAHPTRTTRTGGRRRADAVRIRATVFPLEALRVSPSIPGCAPTGSGPDRSTPGVGPVPS